MTAGRRTARAALAMVVVVIGCGLVRLATFSAAAIGYRYDLDYGEGVVWHQMNAILAGAGYAPLQLFPAVVFEYPPLFHVLTGAVARGFAVDPLAAGRSVALAAAIVSAGLVAVIAGVAGGRAKGARTAAVLAGLLFLVLPVTVAWAPLMRVDMLALAITLAGMIAAARAAARPGWGIAAGLAFALALYAKQTALPAPAGAFAVLLLARPRAAWLMAASAVAGGSVALVAIEVASGGGFLTHIVGYNINRIVWGHARALLLVLLANIAFLALAASALPGVWRQLRGWRERVRTDPAAAMLAVMLAMLAVKTLALPAILKSGASDNYLLDWFAPLAVLAALALRPVVAAAAGDADARPGVAALALAGIGLPVQLLPLPLAPDAAALAAAQAGRDRIAARIAASARPVIGDEMALILRGGQPVLWEPAIMAELGAAGRYDERAFAAMIRRGEFGFFVTRGERGDVAFGERYNPVVADAMAAAYPVRERVGELVVHLPRGGWPGSPGVSSPRAGGASPASRPDPRSPPD